MEQVVLPIPPEVLDKLSKIRAEDLGDNQAIKVSVVFAITIAKTTEYN